MKTTVRTAEKPDFPGIIECIAPTEFRSITLASNLCSAGKPEFPSKGVGSFSVIDQEGIAGVLLLTSTGILLHNLSATLDRTAAARAVREWIVGCPVKCVLGAGEDSLWLEAFLPRQPYRSVDYYLMTLEVPPDEKARKLADSPRFARVNSTGESGGCSALRLKKAKPEDAERLLHLQEGYEKEEVMASGDAFDRDACLANFRKNLGKHVVNYYEVDGEPIAKAGTNARGLAWDQLGGVYTDSRWRSLGLARSLVAETAGELISQGRKTALFVKTGNEPAKRAYNAVGFTGSMPFRISYL